MRTTTRRTSSSSSSASCSSPWPSGSMADGAPSTAAGNHASRGASSPSCSFLPASSTCCRRKGNLVRPRFRSRGGGSSAAAAPLPPERKHLDTLGQAMQAALDGGKPVYVDFTARWCSTCQVNKASYTDEVLAAFKNMASS
ncbi:MAG: thioredoxin family protein [Akkermansia sp.]